MDLQLRFIVNVVLKLFWDHPVSSERARGNIYISEPQMMTLHLTPQQVRQQFGQGKGVNWGQSWGGTFCVHLAIYQIERDSSLAVALHMLTLTLSQTNFEYLTQGGDTSSHTLTCTPNFI